MFQMRTKNHKNLIHKKGKSEVTPNKHLQRLQKMVQEFAVEYQINRTSSGHLAVEIKLCGKKKTVFAPGTPSDYRSMMNVKTKLRKAVNLMKQAAA